MISPLPSTLFVEISERHVRHGVVRDCARCPVALAVGEIVGEDRNPIVDFDEGSGGWTISLLSGEQDDAGPPPRAIYDIPCDAGKWIDDFDNSRVRPDLDSLPSFSVERRQA